MKFQENPPSGVALSYAEGRTERRDEANITMFTEAFRSCFAKSVPTPITTTFIVKQCEVRLSYGRSVSEHRHRGAGEIINNLSQTQN